MHEHHIREAEMVLLRNIMMGLCHIAFPRKTYSTFPRIMRAMFGLPVSTSSGSSRIVDGTKEGQKGFRVLDGR